MKNRNLSVSDLVRIGADTLKAIKEHDIQRGLPYSIELVP
jgi:hypothetical protein